MLVVNIHTAKTELSKLIARAEAGEEIVIARNDKPVVKLVLVEPAEIPKRRKPGSLAHLKGKIPDSLFAPLTDQELKDWERNL